MTRIDNIVETDGALILGAGIAGLFTALKLAPMPSIVLAGTRPGLSGSSTLTGTVTLVATAVDDQALLGVQFALNGQSIGAEALTAAAPAKFPLTWDSHGLANGTYTLTATARDAAGHRTTSAGVTVTISN